MTDGLQGAALSSEEPCDRLTCSCRESRERKPRSEIFMLTFTHMIQEHQDPVGRPDSRTKTSVEKWTCFLHRHATAEVFSQTATWFWNPAAPGSNGEVSEPRLHQQESLWRFYCHYRLHVFSATRSTTCQCWSLLAAILHRHKEGCLMVALQGTCCQLVFFESGTPGSRHGEPLAVRSTSWKRCISPLCPTGGERKVSGRCSCN